MTVYAAPASRATARSGGWQDVPRILLVALAAFVILEGGLALLVGRLDQTWSSLIVTAVMLAVIAVVELVGYRRTPREAWHALGYGRPNGRSLVAVTLIGLAMVALFALYAFATGTPL